MTQHCLAWTRSFHTLPHQAAAHCTSQSETQSHINFQCLVFTQARLARSACLSPLTLSQSSKLQLPPTRKAKFPFQVHHPTGYHAIATEILSPQPPAIFPTPFISPLLTSSQTMHDSTPYLVLLIPSCLGGRKDLPLPKPTRNRQ